MRKHRPVLIFYEERFCFYSDDSFVVKQQWRYIIQHSEWMWGYYSAHSEHVLQCLVWFFLFWSMSNSYFSVILVCLFYTLFRNEDLYSYIRSSHCFYVYPLDFVNFYYGEVCFYESSFSFSKEYYSHFYVSRESSVLGSFEVLIYRFAATSVPLVPHQVISILKTTSVEYASKSLQVRNTTEL